MKVGKVSESVLKRSVLKPIKNRRPEILSGAGVGVDCAIFAPSTGEKCATCVQEGCIGGVLKSIGSTDDIPVQEVITPQISLHHLFQKCINNLVVAGAEAFGCELTLLLPTSMEEPDIKALMQQAEESASEQNLQIMGGQTRVTEMVLAPWAVVTGYGKLAENRNLSGVKPGQDIVLSKWIGLEGTALLAMENEEGLLCRYPAYLVEAAATFDQYYSVAPEAAIAVKSGVCAMHDASEGGIFAALWELAETAGVGLTIDMKKLPLRQETVEVCEFCNVNPYELLSGGCLVMTTQDGPGLVAALESREIPAHIVGKVTDSKDRILINGDETRYMDRPRTDEIYQVKIER